MSLATNVAYAALLPAFLPIHVLFGSGLKKAFAVARTASPVPQMLGRDATTADLPTAVKIDPPVELDYLEHRSAAYVAALALDSCWEAARAVTGENAAEDVPDADLARDLMSSPPAFLMRRTEADDAWVLDCASIRSGRWFNVDRFDITRFVFDLPSGRFELHDASGRVFRPGDPLWTGAKRKLIGQISVWVPAEGHSWSHFWLPDVVAATVHASLPRDTVLYRLLAPHTRFTNRHNHAGLWIQRSVDNSPAPGKRAVPWYALPITAPDMRLALMEEAGRYHRSADHFTLPERLDRRIPYFDFLASYFEVIDAFVARLLPTLEADAYAAWASAVEAWYPGFAKVPMQRALAMIVWHLGVAHAADHLTYVAWGRRFGTSEVATSIEDLAKGASAYDRYRFLAFLNNFADFRPPTSGLDLRLVTSDEAYGFPPGSAAEAAGKQFVADLRSLDTRLAAAGTALVPLDKLIRSICF